ncbi:hypothetical protein EVAR_59666_1 [Eumeta japonica]|uniref:Uncharacterized protein n=1 Tax=Eumeta variegata TaxID=151549 RepID=A0A4C1Z505_EUMVA|nr:hypothetical protein EVAR_59666_1 [Eumeta japonica]
MKQLSKQQIRKRYQQVDTAPTSAVILTNNAGEPLRLTAAGGAGGRASSRLVTQCRRQARKSVLMRGNYPLYPLPVLVSLFLSRWTFRSLQRLAEDVSRHWASVARSASYRCRSDLKSSQHLKL